MNEHLMVAGDGRAVLTFILEQFTSNVGQSNFAQALQLQPIPPHWGSLPQPVSSQEEKKLMLGIEDIKRVIQLLPFALSRTFLQLPRRGASDRLRAAFTEEALSRWRVAEMPTSCKTSRLQQRILKSMPLQRRARQALQLRIKKVR